MVQAKFHKSYLHKKFNFYQFLSLLAAPVNWIPYKAQRHIKELNQKKFILFFSSIPGCAVKLRFACHCFIFSDCQSYQRDFFVCKKIRTTARTAVCWRQREELEEFINDGGRVLTIVYLILEANRVCLIDLDGKTLSTKIIGYDGET